MVRKLYLLVLFAAILALCAPLAVSARSQDANNPEALLPDRPLTGTLPGAPAGSFAYFAVDYPGGGQELVIRMTPRPSDPSSSNRIAFNVYGPSGLVGESRTAQETDPSVRVFRYSSNDPVRLLVQLYNYTLTDTITYTIVASGIAALAPSAPPTPTVAAPVATATPPTGAPPAAAPAPATPQALPEAGGLSGTLVGSAGGAFALVPIPYSGDGSDLVVTATIWPDDSVLAKAVGFVIYAPDGRRVAESTTTATPGERRATLSASAAGNYTVQVFNYAEGATVSYALSW